jgi:hypothetical protein
MTANCIPLPQELENDSSRARVQLARARVRQALKDTPASRAAVAACRSHIDAVLDMYLEVRSCGYAGVQRLETASS